LSFGSPALRFHAPADFCGKDLIMLRLAHCQFLILSTLLFCAFGVLGSAKKSLDEKTKFLGAMAEVEVVPPTGSPELNQASIDLALSMYNIKIPDNVGKPHLDLSMTDRGRTTLYGYTGELEVAVGPNAFASWALLGSTLAHELEVHCRQNFALIRLLDSMGLQGTESAEREAYQHELNYRKRFGLSNEEVIVITETMDYFYPETKENSMSANFVKP
jgi:hypothetical protein